MKLDVGKQTSTLIFEGGDPLAMNVIDMLAERLMVKALIERMKYDRAKISTETRRAVKQRKERIENFTEELYRGMSDGREMDIEDNWPSIAVHLELRESNPQYVDVQRLLVWGVDQTVDIRRE